MGLIPGQRIRFRAWWAILLEIKENGTEYS